MTFKSVYSLLKFSIQQKMETIKLLHSLVSIVAGVEGFEPSQAVLETDVLPLTLYPYVLPDNYYISTIIYFWQVVFRIFFTT